MAKVTAPLLSLGAKGMVGKKVVFQKRPSGHSAFWNKGHADNPSEASLAQRAWFVEAKNAWNALSDEDKQVYISRAKLLPDKPMTGYNLYISEYSGVAPEPIYEWTLQEITGIGASYIYSVGINDDGDIAMVGTYNGRLYSLDGGIWSEIQPKGDLNGKWRGVAVSNDGSKRVACDYDLQIYTYSEGSWTGHTVDAEYRDSWNDADITSDGSKIVAVPGYGRVWMYDWNTWTDLQPSGDHDDSWSKVSISDDGEKILVTDGSGHVYYYNGSSWSILEPESGVTSWFKSASISKNGDYILLFKSDLYLYIFDGTSWTKLYFEDTPECFNDNCRIGNSGDKYVIPYGLETFWQFNGSENVDINPSGEVPSEDNLIDCGADCEVIIAKTNSDEIYIRKEA